MSDKADNIYNVYEDDNLYHVYKDDLASAERDGEPWFSFADWKKDLYEATAKFVKLYQADEDTTEF